jgi:hypothetical protein
MKLNRFALTPTLAMSAALVALSLMGVSACIMGATRLYGLTPRLPLPPAYPDWTVIHFASALVFVALMPWQFIGSLRRRRPGLHRGMGRLAAISGLVMAVSGVAMAYLPEHSVGERVFMTSFFGVFMIFLGRGVADARARRIVEHRAWMVRATATALTPVVQRLIFGVFAGAIGINDTAEFWDLFVGAAWLAWLVNLGVAEIWLRSGRSTATTIHPTRPVAA